MKVIELGCGRKKTAGAVGVDINPRSHADVLCDLNHPPLPFVDGVFDKVICHDVLEHVDNLVPVMEEIWRIGCPGAIVDISVPFMSSVNYYSDPTHRRAFNSRSFDYFIAGTSAFEYGYSDARFEPVSVEYDRDEGCHRRGFHRWMLSWANRNKIAYENRFAFIYPVYQIYFKLRVVK